MALWPHNVCEKVTRFLCKWAKVVSISYANLTHMDINKEAPGDNIGLGVKRDVKESTVTYIQNEKRIWSLSHVRKKDNPSFSMTLPAIDYQKMLESDLVYRDLEPLQMSSREGRKKQAGDYTCSGMNMHLILS